MEPARVTLQLRSISVRILVVHSSRCPSEPQGSALRFQGEEAHQPRE